MRRSNGGHVIGVIPEKLVIKEVIHEGLRPAHREKYARTQGVDGRIIDGFIALPGGYGTFEEFFEVLAMSQLGWHQKTVRPAEHRRLLQASSPIFLDHTASEGFIRPNIASW